MSYTKYQPVSPPPAKMLFDPDPTIEYDPTDEILVPPKPTFRCGICHQDYQGHCFGCTTQVESGSNPHAMTAKEREREVRYLATQPTSIPRDVIKRRLESLVGRRLLDTELSVPERLVEGAKQNRPKGFTTKYGKY